MKGYERTLALSKVKPTWDESKWARTEIMNHMLRLVYSFAVVTNVRSLDLTLVPLRA
jgi:hypothetical protein